MLNNILFILSLFNPSFKLKSDKTVYLKGNGPPVIFSTGLFGVMPNFIYSDIQNKLSQNYTLILNKDYKPFVLNDISDIKNELSVDYLSLFSHSSINSNILESKIFNKIVSCDPIVLPKINSNGLSKRNVNINSDILIIKAEKLYNSDKVLPNFQNPIFNNDKIYSEIIYKDVGHPDILNDYWADLAIYTNFWRGLENKKEIKKYKEWKYTKYIENNKKIQKLRKEYKNYIVKEVNNFL